MVSGSVSLPSRGSFHLSLAVLCAIGQPGIFSLTRWSGLIPTTFHGGSGTWEHIPGRPAGFTYGAFTLCGSGIPPDSATCWFCNSPRGRQPPLDVSLYPSVAKAAAMAPHWFRLFPFRSPLLRESLSVSFPRATKRFCFARFGSHYRGMLSDRIAGFPIRESTDHSLLAAPRGFSQLATPFIPSGCRGIHHGPLAAWPVSTSLLPFASTLILLPCSRFTSTRSIQRIVPCSHFLWRRGDSNP